jgi:THO complex subunit 3
MFWIGVNFPPNDRSSVKVTSFSADGETLATASLDEPKIDFSFVETGECIYSIKTKNNPTAMAFSPTKPLFAYSCDDNGRDRGNISVVSW